MTNTNNSELSLVDIILKIKEIWSYLLQRWKIIVLFSLLGASFGLWKSFSKPYIYEASLKFNLDADNMMSASSFATTFGMANYGDLYSTPESIIILIQTRFLIEKTLLQPIKLKNKNKTFAQLYIETNKLNEDWNSKKKLKDINFRVGENRINFSRTKDSILGTIYERILKSELVLSRIDKGISIIEASIKNVNEEFSKHFLEKLIENVSGYYEETRKNKLLYVVDLFDKEKDSIKVELSQIMNEEASIKDNYFGLNPSMTINVAQVNKKKIDASINSSLLSEIIRSSQKVRTDYLTKKMPIEIIDRPVFPLKKKKFGKLKGLVFGGFLGGFIIISFILWKRFMKKVKLIEQQNNKNEK
jgi:hypothetical protein